VTSPGRRGRETAASAAQYLLLGGFAAVAAGISAQGLTGFARDNMGLRGPWPYLLFLALDGAAGVCAVLLTRRAARAESGVAPRLAVWGLVAASAIFNWTHAPHRPGAAEAFGLMPVIGAVLFEFTLRELRLRSAGRADRQLTALRWAHPAERICVQLLLAADERISAEAATRRVRIDRAARRLYQLRLALQARDHAARHRAVADRRVRAAERSAQAALTRAGFADPDIAVGVLRQVQVLTRTPDLARLDYTTAAAAHAVIAAMISPGLVPSRAPASEPHDRIRIPEHGIVSRQSRTPGSPVNGRPVSSALSADVLVSEAVGGSNGAGSVAPSRAGGRDVNLDPDLVAAAAGIIAGAWQHGRRLSQKALGDQLRRDGHRVANHSLRALMAAASTAEADTQADGRNGSGTAEAAPVARLVDASHLAAVPAWPARETTQDLAGSAGLAGGLDAPAR
jgi:hypothetical protein